MKPGDMVTVSASYPFAGFLYESGSNFSQPLYMRIQPNRVALVLDVRRDTGSKNHVAKVLYDGVAGWCSVADLEVITPGGMGR